MSSDDVKSPSFAVQIAPWLSVPEATQAVHFYKRAFGAIEMERLEDAPGRVAVAQSSAVLGPA